MDEYKSLIRERILARDTFVRATFSGEQKGFSAPWVRVIVRPVEIQGGINLQFSYFDEKKDTTKNYSFQQAASKVDELLALPFRNIFVESNAGNVQVNISKKGRAVVKESRPAGEPAAVNLAHNREKTGILSDENARPFLEAVGIMTKDGRIKADMQRKYRQINEFLRLLDETASFSAGSGSPVNVVDFGCGSAHLTFAMYYYLRDILHLDARVTGVDVKADLIERHQDTAKSMGWDRLSFRTGYIAEYQPEVKPDVVIALHACDTATDDALAKGIQWESRVIVCAPCCQHELQVQLANVSPPNQMQAVFQHGILFERMGDILTDAFRAAILRIMGYRTDVTQFVPIEHTAKNLMIRAVKTTPPGDERRIEEYRSLKTFWQVTPYLEQLLGEPYIEYL